MRRSLVLAFTGVLLSGCYHATIETGLAPSTQVINKPFAHSWIYGLVPPSTVETQRRCPAGVARVETQESFVNGLVNLLTFGIYSPMQITVTCAAGGASGDGVIRVPGDAPATR